jgi:hypothetical protein
MIFFRDCKSYSLDFIRPFSGILSLSDWEWPLNARRRQLHEIEDGASHLLEIKRLIHEHNKEEKQLPLREPDLLIVITGGQMAFTRPDD